MEIDRASPEEVDLIGVLLDDYLAELGANRELPAAAADIRGYTHLDSYWTDPGRHPFLMRLAGRVVGFALVRDPTSTGREASQLAEFYVEPTNRRRGVGRMAAETILRLFPGPWELQVHAENSPALAFWSSVIPTLCIDQPRTAKFLASDGKRLRYSFVVGVDP